MTKETVSYSVTVYAEGQTDPIVVTDSATSHAGELAYRNFIAGQTLKLPVTVDEQECFLYIPYNKVLGIQVCTTTSTETVTDNTCVTE